MKQTQPTAAAEAGSVKTCAESRISCHQLQIFISSKGQISHQITAQQRTHFHWETLVPALSSAINKQGLQSIPASVPVVTDHSLFQSLEAKCSPLQHKVLAIDRVVLVPEANIVADAALTPLAASSLTPVLDS